MEIIEKLEGIESPLEVGLKINEVIDGLKNTSSLPIGTIIPVDANSSYIPEGTLPCDGTEYSKAQFNDLWGNYLTSNLLNTCSYADYESDLATYGQCGKFAVKPAEYDPTSVSIVGVPTITDDGIVRGFGTSDYVSANISNSATNKIEIFTPAIITGSDVSTQQYIVFQNTISDGLAIRLLVAGNQFISTVTNSTNQNVVRGTYRINANTKYFVKYEISKETVAIYISTDNISWTLFTDGSSVNTTNLVKIQQLFDFGIYSQSSSYPFLGTIDLKNFNVVADDEIIFDCIIGDTFRVPTIKDGAVVQQAMSDSELGKAYNEGLPNITGKFAVGRCTNDYGEGAFVKTKNSGYYSSTDNASDGGRYSFDASLSDSTYGKTDDTSLQKVQMNAVALRYFVVVANGSINQSQMDWSKITLKANKSDVDGQWVNAGGIVISTNTAVGTYTLDLSEILPNDSYNYEILLTCFGYGTQSSIAASRVSSEIITTAINGTRCNTNVRQNDNTFSFPVGTGRYITLEITGTAFSDTHEVTLWAYRRLGRNV